ncbi:MAG: carboxylating nicotinate-nucleotide diphosphorylase [Elusimicrobia bacterium]|nr:carboxylating nicotinate-nucleotide diphosphorylase [Elusimicrobiota bacterium]
MHSFIRQALQEDLGKKGDITTKLLLSPSTQIHAFIIAKQPGILCGTKLAESVFKQISSKIKVRLLKKDGQKITPGQKIMKIEGPPSILSTERTALNFLQRLSGIATLTHQFVEKIKGTKTKILDTRKTTPGLRVLEKYAVRCGRGVNHRMGLYDAILIKDNHIKIIRSSKSEALNLKQRILDFKQKCKNIPVEMEAQSLNQVRLALEYGADIIMLDNMPITTLKKAIKTVRKSPAYRTGRQLATRNSRTLIEVSGGVNLDNVRSIAKLGVERISIGQLTHSPEALDMSLEIE